MFHRRLSTRLRLHIRTPTHTHAYTYARLHIRMPTHTHAYAFAYAYVYTSPPCFDIYAYTYFCLYS